MANFVACIQLFVGIVALFTGDSHSATTESVTTTAAACVNTISDCDHHRREEICEGIYKSWAMVRCARYCGFCTGPGTDEPCEDSIPNCNEYLPCEDPAYFVWVADHCRKFCNRCGPAPTGTTAMAAQSTPQSVPTVSNAATTAPATATAATTAAAATTAGTTATATATAPATAAGTTAAATAAASTAATSAGSTAAGMTTASARDTTQGCYDKSADCASYGRLEVCGSGQQADWGRENCANFCHLCGPSTVTATAAANTGNPGAATTAASASPSCQDNLSWCNTYSKTACQNRQWALSYCPGFCDLCQYVTTPVPPSTTVGVTSVPGATTSSGSSSGCRDRLTFCNTYSKSACSNEVWGRNYCANFCGLCQN